MASAAPHFEPTTQPEHEAVVPGPHFKVEYDLDYRGGDYHRTGKMTYIPLAGVVQEGDALKAFTAHTGIPSIHVVFFTLDEIFSATGEPLQK